MDIASIIGLIMCFCFMILGIVTGDQGVSAIGNFWDLPSVMVTFGGSLMCTLAMTDGIPNYLSNLKSFKLILKTTVTNETEVIKKIIDLSNVSRKEGLLALEEAASDIDAELLSYINEKIEARKNAKAEKNYALADAIRAELTEKGITLIDTKEGTKFTIDNK